MLPDPASVNPIPQREKLPLLYWQSSTNENDLISVGLLERNGSDARGVLPERDANGPGTAWGVASLVLRRGSREVPWDAFRDFAIACDTEKTVPSVLEVGQSHRRHGERAAVLPRAVEGRPDPRGDERPEVSSGAPGRWSGGTNIVDAIVRTASRHRAHGLEQVVAERRPVLSKNEKEGVM